MALQAGRLRHRVRIERRVQTQNATTGEMTTSWEAIAASVAAGIEDLSVREFIAAQKEGSQLTSRVVIRRNPALALTGAMRIVCLCACHHGRIFNPAGWLADKESGMEYLTAPVTEGLNNG